MGKAVYTLIVPRVVPTLKTVTEDISTTLSENNSTVVEYKYKIVLQIYQASARGGPWCALLAHY